MVDLPPFPGPIVSVVSAVQNRQQLRFFRDQLVVDALATVSERATAAASAIVDEAEAILT